MLHFASTLSSTEMIRQIRSFAGIIPGDAYLLSGWIDDGNVFRHLRYCAT